jgi:hypothetical protein
LEALAPELAAEVLELRERHREAMALAPDMGEDDALDRLQRVLDLDGYSSDPEWQEVPEALSTVREALERLREERDAAWFEERRGVDAAGNPTVSVWCRRCGVEHQRPEHCPARREPAEAEVRRLTEGLRDLIKEAPEALDQNAVWVDDLLDLLAASPSDGGGECDKCGHAAHKPGDCPANVGTGYFGPVLCRCGVEGGGGA